VGIERAGGLVVLSAAVLLLSAPAAAADPDQTPDGSPAPVTAADGSPAPVATSATTSDTAEPAAVTACSQFAQVLDGSALYYGDFADSLDAYATPDYADPSVSASNTLGRTALRQGAAEAMSAANAPGVPPAIAAPMRTWSVDATKLLIKMGLRGGRESLNTTADEMNNDALAVQQSCAAAGTHA